MTTLIRKSRRYLPLVRNNVGVCRNPNGAFGPAMPPPLHLTTARSRTSLVSMAIGDEVGRFRTSSLSSFSSCRYLLSTRNALVVRVGNEGRAGLSSTRRWWSWWSSSSSSSSLSCLGSREVLASQVEHGTRAVSPPSSAAAYLALSLSLSLLGLSAATYRETLTRLEGKDKKGGEPNDDNDDEKDDDDHTVMNWSGTHSVTLPSSRYHEPESVEELERLVKECHRTGTPLRPIGSALSPNAIGFGEGGMVNLVNLDKIIKIDKKNMTVTVQAGARVGQVVDALRPHNLTLPNLASIAEQQMGGFVQVGAHGTGAQIPPVDGFVSSIKLVTPAKGTITLSEKSGETFHLAKVGLGCFGVVCEVTMKVVPAHNLVEHTFVLTRAEAKAKLESLLAFHKHVRYMWIPYEDAVVVVTNDPEGEVSNEEIDSASSSLSSSSRPLTDLLMKLAREKGENYKTYTDETVVKSMGFGELRDALLAFDPLDVRHVKRVNKAEAKFWRLSEGYRMKPSDQLLQFDCGGQQWVWEICFPTGRYSRDSGKDMELIDRLLREIETEGIAAPAPIEQRWTASSSSLMSPAYGPKDGLHSWVGIIMYLPLEEEGQRKQITKEFKERYCRLLRKIGRNYNAASHWAKLEIPENNSDLARLKKSIRARYPVDKFNKTRAMYDPKNIFGNEQISSIFD